MDHAPETPLAARRSYGWIGRAAFEAVLIVFGLVGALLVDEWRDARARAERVQIALASIRAELAVNQKAMAAAIQNHRNVIKGLLESATSGQTYNGGIISAPPFSSVAWDAARDAAVTQDIDHQTLMLLGSGYRAIADYEAERTVFLNFVYTGDTQKLRETPRGLAGWLNDMLTHARDAEKRVHAASVALGAAPPAPPGVAPPAASPELKP